MLHVDAAQYERPLAEPMAALIVALAQPYEHIVASLACWLLASIQALQGTHSQLGESVFTVLATLATITASANRCGMPNLAPGQEIVRLLTVLAAILTAGLIDALRELFPDPRRQPRAARPRR